MYLWHFLTWESYFQPLPTKRQGDKGKGKDKQRQNREQTQNGILKTLYLLFKGLKGLVPFQRKLYAGENEDDLERNSPFPYSCQDSRILVRLNFCFVKYFQLVHVVSSSWVYNGLQPFFFEDFQSFHASQSWSLLYPSMRLRTMKYHTISFDTSLFDNLAKRAILSSFFQWFFQCF